MNLFFQDSGSCETTVVKPSFAYRTERVDQDNGRVVDN